MELLRNTSQNKRKSESVICPSLKIVKANLDILTRKPWTIIYCQRDIKFGIYMKVYVRTYTGSIDINSNSYIIHIM